MRLYRVKNFSGIGGLSLQEDADPGSPDSRQVVVRVHATSLNYRDLMGIRGELAHFGGMPLDHIPLCDGAGEVVATGPLVTRVKVGDRVGFTFHPSWIGGEIPHDLNILGRSSVLNDGLLTEFSTVDESELVALPPHLSYEEAATLPCAAVTAWFAIHGENSMKPGQSVLIQGTGGVSLFALQFAKLSGARVIATTTTPSKMAILRKLGADTVVDASAGADWKNRVLEATDGVGVDVTVEVGGAATFDKSAAATRCGGRMSLVGVLSGPPTTDQATYFFRGLRVRPTRVGSREHFEAMNRAISAARLLPVIDKVFPFEKAGEAFERLESGSHVGKIVIKHS